MKVTRGGNNAKYFPIYLPPRSLIQTIQFADDKIHKLISLSVVLHKTRRREKVFNNSHHHRTHTLFFSDEVYA